VRALRDVASATSDRLKTAMASHQPTKTHVTEAKVLGDIVAVSIVASGLNTLAKRWPPTPITQATTAPRSRSRLNRAGCRICAAI